MRRLLALTFLAAVAVPAGAACPAAAQGVPHRDRDTAVVRSRGFDFYSGPEGVRVESFQRGRLGILVDLTVDPARDSIGARVAGVTPGGAAEKAGVRAGDIVVRLNGTPLARGAARSDDEDQGDGGLPRPAMRLIKLASRLDPGDTVHLDLRRDNRPLSLTLVAGESGADQFTRQFDLTLPPGGGPMRVPFPNGEMSFFTTGAPLASMELVKISRGLADYFGTATGLLVVNVGNDSTLGLRDGDVILSIGGREPMSPAHALRILGTYEPSETVTFDVMRMKRRVTVTGKMPERRHGAWTISPNAFDVGPMTRSFAPEAAWQELPRMLLKLPYVAPTVRAHAVRVET